MITILIPNEIVAERDYCGIRVAYGLWACQYNRSNHPKDNSYCMLYREDIISVKCKPWGKSKIKYKPMRCKKCMDAEIKINK